MRAVLLALVSVGTLASGCSPPAPITAEPPLASKLQRDEAIAIVRAQDIFGRVDRADAKLMTFDEYVRIAGPVRTRQGDPQAAPNTGFRIIGDQQRPVWAVAISGQVWPNGRTPVVFGAPLQVVSPTPYPPYRWAIFLVDAVPGQLMVVGDAGVNEAWPSVFSALPDHAVAP